MPDLFISPHNDDAALFGAFTVIRHQPLVVTVYNSYSQGNVEQRQGEDRAAIQILNPGGQIMFLGYDDRKNESMEKPLRDLARAYRAGTVWLPAVEANGQRHHNLIGAAGSRIFRHAGWKIRQYYTYTERGKTTWGEVVKFEPDWVRRKLLALACYESQIARPDTNPHFVRGLDEFMVPVEPT